MPEIIRRRDARGAVPVLQGLVSARSDGGHRRRSTSIPRRSRSTIKAQFGDLQEPAERAQAPRAARVPAADGDARLDRDRQGVDARQHPDHEHRAAPLEREPQGRSPPARRADLQRRSSTSGSTELRAKQETPFTDAGVSIATPDGMREIDAFTREADGQAGPARGRVARADHRDRCASSATASRRPSSTARARSCMRTYEEAADREATTEQPRLHRARSFATSCSTS